MSEDISEHPAYQQGEKAATRRVLQHCIRELGAEDADAAYARLVQEREALVVLLRRVCRRFGDNDWPDSLYLPDVVEKHLEHHLESGDGTNGA